MSVNHAILGVLLEGPCHGYEIASELEHRIAGGRYNSAQIYLGLRALAERGYILSENPEPGISRDRRPFRITEAGRSEFERWVRAPLSVSRPMRDQAIVKLVFLGRRDPVRLRTLLERLRREHVRSLAALSIQQGKVERDPWTELSAMALRIREEAELRWIEYVVERLATNPSADRADDRSPAALSKAAKR